MGSKERENKSNTTKPFYVMISVCLVIFKLYCKYSLVESKVPDGVNVYFLVNYIFKKKKKGLY